MSSAAEDEHPVKRRERERCRKAVQARWIDLGRGVNRSATVIGRKPGGALVQQFLQVVWHTCIILAHRRHGLGWFFLYSG